MAQPEKHTIVQLKLRSLLAIMIGASLVMAVASPYLRKLASEDQRHLLFAMLLLGCGMVVSTVICIYRRYKIGSICGPLLLTISNQTTVSRRRRKWLFLLVQVPGYSFFAYTLSRIEREDFLDYLTLILVLAFYGGALAQGMLENWSEGYTDSLQFCENGILIGTKFYPWNSGKPRSLDWESRGKLAVEFNLATMRIDVPLHQREAVDAILEHYHRPHRASAKDQI